MSGLKTCFVIAPIGEADSETRKRSDQVLKHIIRPAVESCGYTAVRADEIDKPGIITSQVIQHVVGDALVVADLTERNPNVFYELAIRHAIRKPFVQIIKKGERIPFDVAGTRTIHFDHHDLDSVDSAKKEIVSQIKSLEQDASELETPISVSLELQLLRQSDDPEERSLATLVAAVSELRASLGKIEAKVGPSEGQGALDQIQEALKALPARLEERLDLGSPISRKRRRPHPGMFFELAQIVSRETETPMGLLVLASAFRDDFPWLYELALDLYRKAKGRNSRATLDALDKFRRVAKYTLHGPWLREAIGGKEAYIFLEEIPFMMENLLSDTLSYEENTPKGKRSVPTSGKGGKGA